MNIPSTATSEAPSPALDALTSERPAAKRSISHAELSKVLHRAGYTTTESQSIVRGLPDPIDFDRDGDRLFKRGVSLDRLTDTMGGSP